VVALLLGAFSHASLAEDTIHYRMATRDTLIGLSERALLTPAAW